MDSVDNIDPEIIIVVEGHYGVVDRLGFHSSPEPTFEEEVQRDPRAAMQNRLARAKKFEVQGRIKISKQLRKEACQIKKIICAMS